METLSGACAVWMLRLLLGAPCFMSEFDEWDCSGGLRVCVCVHVCVRVCNSLSLFLSVCVSESMCACVYMYMCLCSIGSLDFVFVVSSLSRSHIFLVCGILCFMRTWSVIAHMLYVR